MAVTRTACCSARTRSRASWESVARRCARRSCNWRPRSSSRSTHGAGRSYGRSLPRRGRRRPRSATADRASVCARRVAVDGEALAAALNGAIAEQERALLDAGAGFVRADRGFHRLIVAANRNEILTHQYDALWDRQRRMLATAIARDSARMTKFIAEHRQIATAIERCDPTAAAELISAHLRGAYERARSRF